MRSLQGRNTMTSQPMRDQVEDHLITPKNAALLIIDYQPPQVSSIVSMDHRTLVANIVATARLAKVFALPIVLSTVNVKTGGGGATVPPTAGEAGAQPSSVVQLMCELQRDWSRTETVQPVREILFALEGR